MLKDIELSVTFQGKQGDQMNINVRNEMKSVIAARHRIEK
jgi:hypothetical protein